jgi:hypothetical protein
MQVTYERCAEQFQHYFVKGLRRLGLKVLFQPCFEGEHQ